MFLICLIFSIAMSQKGITVLINLKLLFNFQAEN